MRILFTIEPHRESDSELHDHCATALTWLSAQTIQEMMSMSSGQTQPGNGSKLSTPYPYEEGGLKKEFLTDRFTQRLAEPASMLSHCSLDGLLDKIVRLDEVTIGKIHRLEVKCFFFD